jgi:PPOX class probable F420-dependent enzyme
MALLSDALAQELLAGRYIAALATGSPDGSIHMIAVWYWFDGAHIYVATSGKSRKIRNLRSNANVSLMIDSRDPAASRGVTIVGTAEVLSGAASERCNATIHQKYLSDAARRDTRVGPVFAGWDDMTIKIKPKSVVGWDMRELDRQVLGGALRENPDYLLPLER